MNRAILSIALLAQIAPAAAQETHDHSGCDHDSIQEAILSEVTVSGLTGTQRMKDSPISFSVITPHRLHQSLGTNIVDAITLQPGISQISTGAGISKPVIRGLGYNRVVVLEQGIRQEGQQWGDEHGLEVDAEGVHSVEVLKGPASLMYGSDAIAGVLILHPEPMLEEGTIQTKVGGEYQTNNGLYTYHIGTAGNIDGWLWNWHFADKGAHCYKNSRDGYVPGTWFKERDIQGMMGYNGHWGHSWVRLSHVDFTPGITEGERNLFPRHSDQFGELIWKEGASAHSYKNRLPFQRVLHTKAASDNVWYLGTGSIKAIIGYQQNYRREFEESADESELAMRLHTINYDLRYQAPLDNGWSIGAGINGMWQKNENEAEEMLIPDYDLLDIGCFFTTEKQLEQWHLSGGIRIDHRYLSTSETIREGQKRFDALSMDFGGITGSIGSVYNLNDALNLRLNIARGFRAPAVSELCSDGVHEGSVQYELGNAALKSEFSTQIDLGMDYTTKYAALNASLFCNWINNYIFLQRLQFLTDGYRTYQYRQGDARLMGGEISIDIHPINSLHIENSLSYVRGIQLHQPSESHNLPMIPAPRWNLDLRYEWADFARGHCQRTYLSVCMNYQFRQDHFYALDNTETATPDYALFNLSAGMDLHLFGHNCMEITLSAQNIFDKVYQSHLSRLKYTDGPGISAMGRNLCLKVNLPIDIHIHP